jgi:hypothetical protein
MLLVTAVLVVLLALFGCAVNTFPPSDTSQPDHCDPKGPCNVGKKPGTPR